MFAKVIDVLRRVFLFIYLFMLGLDLLRELGVVINGRLKPVQLKALVELEFERNTQEYRFLLQEPENDDDIKVTYFHLQFSPAH